METILNNIKNTKILVIGDIMLDHYIWGDATRISPEAPVPVVHIAKDSYVPGGSANVALNLSSLGVKASLIGSIANDDPGSHLKSLLAQANVSFDPRFGKCDAPTILKTRVLVRNQQLCRLDRESPPPHYTINDEELLSLIEEKAKYADAIIFSDYNKGVITNEVINRVISVTTNKNILLAIDPKPRNDLSLQGLHLITPNRNEALALADIHLNHHDKFPVEKVCKSLFHRFASPYIVITMGQDGMIICENGQNIKVIPTFAKEVFDVSGAGDTVVAALTAALASGSSLENAAIFANIAAGIVVSKIGTATVKPQEILSRSNQLEPLSPLLS